MVIQVAELVPGCCPFQAPSWSPWATWLLGLHGRVLSAECAWTHQQILHQVKKREWERERGAHSWRPWTMWLLRSRGTWREQVKNCTSCRSWDKTLSKSRFLVHQVYIGLGVGRTRCFLKMTNQLPKLVHACAYFPTNLFFPRLAWQASLVQHYPLCHFIVAHVSVFPWSPPPKSGTGGAPEGLFACSV